MNEAEHERHHSHTAAGVAFDAIPQICSGSSDGKHEGSAAERKVPAGNPQDGSLSWCDEEISASGQANQAGNMHEGFKQEEHDSQQGGGKLALNAEEDAESRQNEGRADEDGPEHLAGHP
jgi:hypothetical protein